MMLVYLVRQFTFDQVNHVSKTKIQEKPLNLILKFVKILELEIPLVLKMAPFIVNHPTLLNNWILCREQH